MRTVPRIHCRRLELGLTLGEMLVVLAVCSILAVMFFFSSSHAVIKTKLSRVLQDEKYLANALQTYEIDYYDIPSEVQGLGRLRLEREVPQDPFALPGQHPKPYAYYPGISPNHRWMVVSAGPDGILDVDDAIAQLKKNSVKLSSIEGSGKVLMPASDVKDFVTRYSYDPTNGSVSKGDVITVYGQ